MTQLFFMNWNFLLSIRFFCLFVCDIFRSIWLELFVSLCRSLQVYRLDFFFIPTVSGSTIYFRVFLRLILLFKIYEIFFLSLPLSLLTIIFPNILYSLTKCFCVCYKKMGKKLIFLSGNFTLIKYSTHNVGLHRFYFNDNE